MSCTVILTCLHQDALSLASKKEETHSCKMHSHPEVVSFRYPSGSFQNNPKLTQESEENAMLSQTC